MIFKHQKNNEKELALPHQKREKDSKGRSDNAYLVVPAALAVFFILTIQQVLNPADILILLVLVLPRTSVRG
jgi:hypothetical protein